MFQSFSDLAYECPAFVGVKKVKGMCMCKVLFKQVMCSFNLNLHILIYMCVVLKNLKLKDLIYQNVMINDTVVNANFMANTEKKGKSPLLLSMFYPFLKTIQGKNTLRGEK